MAILVRIHLPNRGEYRRVIRTKKDYFVLGGDNYHIDYNKSYRTTTWGGLFRVDCLEYEKGKEEPIGFFQHELKTSTELRPHHVAEVIRRLIEEVPHFQLIVLILLIIVIIVCGVGVYFSYQASNNTDGIKNVLQNIYNNTMRLPNGL